MRRVRHRDTSPELRLRRALWASGLRGYRVAAPEVAGKPDISWKRRNLAVFVDGAFWHGHPKKYWYGRSGDYWDRKIARNILRDARTTSELERDGWQVIRLWDFEVETDLSQCVQRIRHATRSGAVARPDAVGRFAEFFAGIGLMRLAVERVGWRTVFANDIDSRKQQIYQANFGSDGFVLSDVRRLRGSDIPDIELATASFPCVDLSLAGERRGLTGEDSGTVREFFRLLREMGERRPAMTVLENVLGFATSNSGQDLRKSIGTLNDLGYVCDILQLDARHFVPQSRPRLFVIGSREKVWPGWTSEMASVLRPKWVADFVQTNDDLDFHFAPVALDRRWPPDLESIFDDMPRESSLWWDEEKVRYNMSQMAPRHRQRVDEHMKGRRLTRMFAFRRTRNGEVRLETRIDGVAGCLRAVRGGSSRQILIEAGAQEVWMRFLTAREYARLQGVPDDFQLDGGSVHKTLFALGDAVCVPVVEWLARAYLNPLRHILAHQEDLARTVGT